ncbi:hypothetical protein ACXET9_07245 [Brachybacterium sp. DNPG3]
MADGQNLPEPATSHYRLMQALQLRAIRRGRRAWAQIDPDHLSASWRELLPLITASISEVQGDATTAAADYNAFTLADRDEYELPRSFVNTSAFTGVLDDGGDLSAAMYMPLIRTKRGLAGGLTMRQALAVGRDSLDRIAAGAVRDSARAVASVDTASRDNVGYIRMLNPPSCPRCAILAGRFYRWNLGFDRHPNCDCIHVAAKNTAALQDEGLIADPYAYFSSLSAEDQDRIFGKSEARALRDGADIFQVVNARRGMSRVGARPGQRARVTTEGTSRHGSFTRRGGAGRTRRTVDEIYRTAGTRTRALRMLEEDGYVLPGGQDPAGTMRDLRAPAKNASRATRESWLTGTRLPRNMQTMTAAEQRRYRADRDWQMIRAGMNPYQAGAAQRWRYTVFGEGTPHGGSTPRPPTDADRARAERAYRRYVLGEDGGDTALGTRHTLPAQGTRI